MKIILISLPHPYLKRPDAQAPLGLLYLASSLLECALLKVEVKNYSSFTTEEALADLPKADIYGISITSMELLQANRFAEKIKEKYPDPKIFLGGPGTVSPEFVDWDYVDSICKGEGDRTILTMVNDARDGVLKRMYEGEPVENLDDLPLPARHLLGDEQGGGIFAYDRNYIDEGSVTILTSRGCPFNCAFCSAPILNQRVRFRNPEAIGGEVRHVIERYGIKQFRVSDDMFTANPKHVSDICRAVKDFDIAWRISIRAKPLTKAILKTLHDAGCREVSIGVESFDDGVLKMLNKGTTAEDNALALEMCAEVGMKARVLFMIRTPGQTSETVSINIEYLKRVPYAIIACMTFIPLPGSDIWANPDKYNIEILDRNMDNYNYYFFNRNGENRPMDLIKIKDRSLKEFNGESFYFKDYLKGTGKLNTG